MGEAEEKPDIFQLTSHSFQEYACETNSGEPIRKNMPQSSISICLESGGLPDGPIQGFRFFWAFYVNGYRSDRHCQPCFKGRRVKEFSTGRVHSGRSYVLTPPKPGEYLYICGVGTGPKHTLGTKNLHLPLRYASGGTVTSRTYNGYVVHVQNAVVLPIPPLAPGWNDLELETTRCKNYQFAVAYFGSEPMILPGR